MWELLFQAVFTREFCCAANPRPQKTRTSPTSLQDLFTAWSWQCLPNPPFVGGVERGLTLSSVLSSHMEFQRPQRSRASIWRAQELRASPSCPHGSCACSPRTKLIRGLVRTLRGCSELSWKSPGITPLPGEGSMYEQLPSIRLGAGRSRYPSWALSHSTEWGKILSQQQRDADKSSLKPWSMQGGLQQPFPQLPAEMPI